jgi:hypothetical protein
MIDQIETEDSSSLSLHSKAFLSEAAGWARFMAIVGFVLLGLGTIGMLFAGSSLALLGASGVPTALIIGIFLVFGIIWFFVSFYLFRFGSKMKEALQFQSRELIDQSFENLKSYFKLMGILTIIYLAFYALILLFSGLSSMF